MIPLLTIVYGLLCQAQGRCVLWNLCRCQRTIWWRRQVFPSTTWVLRMELWSSYLATSEPVPPGATHSLNPALSMAYSERPAVQWLRKWKSVDLGFEVVVLALPSFDNLLNRAHSIPNFFILPLSIDGRYICMTSLLPEYKMYSLKFEDSDCEA